MIKLYTTNHVKIKIWNHAFQHVWKNTANYVCENAEGYFVNHLIEKAKTNGQHTVWSYLMCDLRNHTKLK
jgi:hypothetical protein